MKRFEIFAAALLALAVASPGAAAEERKAGWDWQGTVAAGDADIEIRVPSTAGSTRTAPPATRSWYRDAHRAPRRSRGREDRGRRAPGGRDDLRRLSFDRQAQRVPARRGRPDERAEQRRQRQFKVEVPRGVRFVGRTVNGGIHARGIEADAEAHTVNGGIEVEAAGTARADTVNGGITARLGRGGLDGNARPEDRQRRHRRVPALERDGGGEGDDRERGHRDRLPPDGHRQVRPSPDPGHDRRRGRRTTLALETVNGGIALRKAM